ncbi:hypothetical protein [Desulfovibrio ferrophilus]|uniref:Sodium-driven chloride bicarbonate exchanger n=1 Tax=Desulfovibrio ferrophilus TaxID=241368 RepID=A0A2Z6B3Q7_9BACT|nr:hypothetical protein [Desulfovibrio ferrophilus]BBD10121.1 sodium-driven chloride bicarbonate exchanger [Desulfovibrio ferrophilus]
MNLRAMKTKKFWSTSFVYLISSAFPVLLIVGLGIAIVQMFGGIINPAGLYEEVMMNVAQDISKAVSILVDVLGPVPWWVIFAIPLWFAFREGYRRSTDNEGRAQS